MTSTSDVSGDVSGASYRAVLARLQSRGRFGVRLGLGRTRALLSLLGDPHLGLPGVLIGGTNGKGSTQALVSGALIAAGYRVGQTPKPHLTTYRERLTVNGEPIARDDFALLVSEVLDQADLVARRHGPPTEFEVLTAAAFMWFRRAGVEVAVVEVGLGGRLDATNVWQGGVSAITNVALDHTEHLGPTLVHIAREKAQIIKRGDSLALTMAQPPALGVIRRRAARVAVPLQVVQPWPVSGHDQRGVTLRGPDGMELSVGLLGRHQAANAALAWHVLDALEDAGIATVGETQRREAFAGARWPGRLELLPAADGRPAVLLDGAHNPHGAAALAAALDELVPQLPAAGVSLLLGVVRDKDVQGVVDALRESSVLRGAKVLTTDVPDTPRAMPAADLAALWPGSTPVTDPDAGLQRAMENAAQSGAIVVVCGSLYLVGHIRARLLGLEAD